MRISEIEVDDGNEGHLTMYGVTGRTALVRTSRWVGLPVGAES